MSGGPSTPYPIHDQDDIPVIYYVDDMDSDVEWSDPELYSTSSATTGSVETLASSEVHEYFRPMHGRMFPADVNVALSLPTDSAEILRCLDQHKALKAFFGANYWGPVEQVLAPTPGRGDRKRVLDMMTTEGSWAQDMSQQFPHVDFVSVDNVPLTSHIPRPNVDFEIYDLYNGIASPDESFDVVHMRFAMMQLKRPKDLIRDVHRILKPGGLLLFADFELDAFDGRDPALPAYSALPNLCEAFRIGCDALTRQGVDVHMGSNLPSWLSSESDLWLERRAVDGDGDGDKLVGFRDIHSESHVIPAGPWPEDKRLKMVGMITGRAWRHTWRSMEAPFQVFGIDAARAKQIVQGAVDEIGRLDVAVAAKFDTVYAFKI